MKKGFIIGLAILILSTSAYAAERVVHYEHFTADW